MTDLGRTEVRDIDDRLREHLVELPRPHVQALEDKVLAARRPALAVVKPMEVRDAA